MGGESEEAWLKPGADVEVQTLTDPGLANAWFPGLLLEVSEDCTRGKVQYERLTRGGSDDALDVEDIHFQVAQPKELGAGGRRGKGGDEGGAHVIRPKPPASAKAVWPPEKWAVGEWVEVEARDCWWEAVVTRLPQDGCAGGFLVVYPDFLNYKECEIKVDEVRPLYEWQESFKCWKPRDRMTPGAVAVLLKRMMAGEPKARSKHGRRK